MTETTSRQLLIDVGNTSIKWCVLEGSDGAHDVESLPDQDDLTVLTRIAEAEPEMPIAISCVRSDDFADRLSDQLGLAGASQVYAASTEQGLMGFQVAYDNPESLGVDRWLAMLAARRQDTRPVVVVDAGTACTIDVLIGDTHQGGYILSGATLSQRSLIKETDKIRFHSVAGSSVRPGSSTSACVVNGSWLALSGAIKQVLADFPDAELLIDGGDAADLIALGVRGTLTRGLVFRGLSIWLRHLLATRA